MAVCITSPKSIRFSNQERDMRTTAIAIISAAAASAASAGIVDVQYNSVGAGGTVQFVEIGQDARDVFAGELNHTISNGMGADAILNGAQRTFCPDIGEMVAFDQESYFTTDIENIPTTDGGAMPMGAMKADAIRSLYSFSAGTLMAGGLSDAYASAFAIVIWEVVADFDGTAASIDVAAGNAMFNKTDGTALNSDVLMLIDSLAADMVAAIDAGAGSFGGVVGLANIGRQDQLVVIPTPGALALMSIGGLMATRRRRS